MKNQSRRERGERRRERGGREEGEREEERERGGREKGGEREKERGGEREEGGRDGNNRVESIEVLTIIQPTHRQLTHSLCVAILRD